MALSLAAGIVAVVVLIPAPLDIPLDVPNLCDNPDYARDNPRVCGEIYRIAPPYPSFPSTGNGGGSSTGGSGGDDAGLIGSLGRALHRLTGGLL